jgi:hypothetical protein
MTHRNETNFDEVSQRLDIEAQEVDEAGAFLPIGGAIESAIEETAAEHSFHVEKDRDSAEGDNDLLSGHSPEFEHLVRRSPQE